MNNKTPMEYQAPEIMELGDASTMTLGCTGSNCDSCNCAKCGDELTDVISCGS